MQILPKTNRVLFGLFPLIVEACIIFSFFVLIGFHATIARYDDMPARIHSEMKMVANPIEIFSLIAGAFLFVVGTYDWLQRRRLKAVVGFIFVLLALYCCMFAQSFTVHAK
jgi:uncharacterized membrane protein YozB (DUF420 family)